MVLRHAARLGPALPSGDQCRPHQPYRAVESAGLAFMEGFLVMGTADPRDITRRSEDWGAVPFTAARMAAATRAATTAPRATTEETAQLPAASKASFPTK